jgi:hypothetical protein
MSSKHRRELSQEVEDVKEKEGDEEEAKEEEQDKEELWDECEGGYPDSEYPPPPVLEEQVSAALPCQEDQEMPPEEWKCHLCGKSPCIFLRWEE